MPDQDKTPEDPKAEARSGFVQSTRRTFLSRLGMAGLVASAGSVFGNARAPNRLR